jgi:tetrahydromethanopterin S-methyltransferase subunit F
MGQAKQRKLRLGKWYGQPIEPGHPDFVLPKKPELKSTRQVDRVVEEQIAIDTARAIPEATYLLTNQTDSSQNGVYTANAEGNLHRAESTKEEPIHVEATKARTGIVGRGGMALPSRSRRYPGLAIGMLLATAAIGGMSLGPEPESRPRKK